LRELARKQNQYSGFLKSFLQPKVNNFIKFWLQIIAFKARFGIFAKILADDV
jgi:hypothetical protein